jgi:hypothetical protein
MSPVDVVETSPTHGHAVSAEKLQKIMHPTLSNIFAQKMGNRGGEMSLSATDDISPLPRMTPPLTYHECPH